MNRILRILLAAGSFWGTSNALAHAQQTDGFTLSGGYQLLRLEEGVVRAQSSGEEIFRVEDLIAHGWSAEVTAPITPVFRVVAEGGGASYTIGVPVEDFLLADTSIHMKLLGFSTGLRAATTYRRLSPFVQVLAGGSHETSRVDFSGTAVARFVREVLEREINNSGTRFTLQTGGGADWWLAERFGIRTAVHYRRLFLDADEGGSKNQLAVTAGITVPVL